MKRKFLFLTILSACIALLSACGKDDPEPPHSTLIVASKDTNASWKGGKIAITIKANENWSASCPDWWCSLSPASGIGNRKNKDGVLTNMIATVDPNLTDQQRSTEITVTMNLITSVVKITQDPMPNIEIPNDVIDFGKQAESKTFVLRSNADWSISSSEGWCKVTPAAGKKGTTAVTVSVDANQSTEHRRAQLDINVDEARVSKIIIYQASVDD